MKPREGKHEALIVFALVCARDHGLVSQCNTGWEDLLILSGRCSAPMHKLKPAHKPQDIAYWFLATLISCQMRHVESFTHVLKHAVALLSMLRKPGGQRNDDTVT